MQQDAESPVPAASRHRLFRQVQRVYPVKATLVRFIAHAAVLLDLSAIMNSLDGILFGKTSCRNIAILQPVR